VQNEDKNLSAGSNGTGKLALPPSSTDSLLPTLTRLSVAMEKQNEALWALVHQTASLVSLLAEGDGGDDDDDDADPRYLDGTRIRRDG
jgi:hypothetical protein